MHDAHMKMLARILGEVYRIQNAIEGMHPSASDSHVYGLLKGFETSIDSELEQADGISKEKLRHMDEVLSEIFDNEEKLAQFQGFYDIEDELRSRGINRVDAMKILKFLKADYRFTELIDKMDSSGSPTECRTFELYEDEK